MSVMKTSQNDASTSLPARALAAEFLGTALLLSIVVGSGIMAERLSGGSVGLALLGNTVATGTGLIVLILAFGPVSGAHFNPVVSLMEGLRGSFSPMRVLGYGVCQVAGAVAGVWLAHLMFDEQVLQLSTRLRDGEGQWISEAVATFGLIGTIVSTSRTRAEVTPFAVGLYITSAYWFTASTSFANPAVTLARSLSNTFAGIAPASVPPFIVAQLAGGILAFFVFNWFYHTDAKS
jgi:glycerol uptake facilitator-like aquaporin